MLLTLIHAHALADDETLHICECNCWPISIAADVIIHKFQITTSTPIATTTTTVTSRPHAHTCTCANSATIAAATATAAAAVSCRARALAHAFDWWSGSFEADRRTALATSSGADVWSTAHAVIQHMATRRAHATRGAGAGTVTPSAFGSCVLLLLLLCWLTARLLPPVVGWTACERGVARDGLQPTDDDTRRLVGVDGTVMGASDGASDRLESIWSDVHGRVRTPPHSNILLAGWEPRSAPIIGWE